MWRSIKRSPKWYWGHGRSKDRDRDKDTEWEWWRGGGGPSSLSKHSSRDKLNRERAEDRRRTRRGESPTYIMAAATMRAATQLMHSTKMTEHVTPPRDCEIPTAYCPTTRTTTTRMTNTTTTRIICAEEQTRPTNHPEIAEQERPWTCLACPLRWVLTDGMTDCLTAWQTDWMTTLPVTDWLYAHWNVMLDCNSFTMSVSYLSICYLICFRLMYLFDFST